MKYETTLQVTKKELYQLILQSLLQEIQTYQPFIQEEDLVENYQYEKNMIGMLGQQIPVHVKIMQLVPDCSYAVAFESERGITQIKYELLEKEEQVHVIYQEEFKSFSKINQLNYHLISPFYQKRSHKKIAQMFKQMEIYIQNKEIIS